MMGVAMVLFSLCLVASVQIESKNKVPNKENEQQFTISYQSEEHCDEENISLISCSKPSYDAA